MKIKKIKNNLVKSQETRFLIVGIFNTILDFSILFGLKAIGLDSVISNIFSTSVSFVFSFSMNKKFTFKSKNKTKKELLREIASFTLVTLFGLWIIQSIIITFVSNNININFSGIELTLLFAKIIATVFSLIWNFILYKRFVFKTN